MELTIIPAYFLDLLIGDPRGYPHPVRIIGWATRRLESIGRKWLANQFLAGTTLTVFIVGVTYFITFAVIKGLAWLSPLAGTIGSIMLIYTTISVRDLYQESRPILTYLHQDDLVRARASLGMIVGRDTHNLDKQGIIKATIESISESTIDGIVSPLFYACIGGAPLALAYKAVNTLDSMIGHNDETYHLFGKFAARLDDVANYIPARIGGIIIVIASFICGQSASGSFRILFRDGQKHASPNSGIPEAAFAGALGVQLGGDSFYDGIKTTKPFIGSATKIAESDDIAKSHNIMFVTSGITLVMLIVAGNIIKF
jgi:adenosylcobinamide-phosphate synthase